MMSRDTIFFACKGEVGSNRQKDCTLHEETDKRGCKSRFDPSAGCFDFKACTSAIKASGVAMTDRLDIVFVTRNGSLIWETEASRPNRIPKIIGFVAIPLRDLTSPFYRACVHPVR